MNKFLIFAITFIISISLIGCASSPESGKKPAANTSAAAPTQAEAKPAPAENKNSAANSTDFGKSDADRTDDGKSDADRSNSNK
jgi:hypothetical protein